MNTIKGVPSIGMVKPHVCADQRNASSIKNLTIDEAVVRYDYIVKQVAKIFHAVYPHVPIEDMWQEGSLAIIEVVQSTDLSNGYNRFSALLTDAVNRKIRSFCEADYLNANAELPLSATLSIDSVILKHDIQSFLSRLPKKQQQLLRLHFIEEISIRSIAEQYGVSYGYMSTYIRKAVWIARRACYRRRFLSDYSD